MKESEESKICKRNSDQYRERESYPFHRIVRAASLLK